MQTFFEYVLTVVLASKLHEYALLAWRHNKKNPDTIIHKKGLMYTTQSYKCNFNGDICEVDTNNNILNLNQIDLFPFALPIFNYFLEHFDLLILFN